MSELKIRVRMADVARDNGIDYDVLLGAAKLGDAPFFMPEETPRFFCGWDTKVRPWLALNLDRFRAAGSVREV